MGRKICINNNVRRLLLDMDFLTLVLGSQTATADAKTHSHALVHPLLTYTSEEIEDAKYILLHLDEFNGAFTKEDIEDMKNRIKYRLNG